jgi:hypothetical protein
MNQLVRTVSDFFYDGKKTVDSAGKRHYEDHHGGGLFALASHPRRALAAIVAWWPIRICQGHEIRSDPRATKFVRCSFDALVGFLRPPQIRS